jgi:heterodisulfide reductase subunit A
LVAISETDVLIIGGGVAGLAAAAELSRRGLGSLLVERGAALGGQAARFCCKALAACARCGACRLGDLLSAAGGQEGKAGLSALTRAVPASARPAPGGGWEVELAPGPVAADLETAQAIVQFWAPALDAPRTVHARAVILACGHTPFDTRTKTRFGHGRVAGVMSALELEQALAQGGPGGLTPTPGRVAFIQCVGSRDHELGRRYCSRVCCGFGLRLARLLKAQAEGVEVTFFHMDVQGYGRAWEAELPEMRRELRFIRAMPGEVTRGAQGGAEVVWAGPEGLPAREVFDLVVLSQGLGPAAGAEGLAALFSAGRTPDGFLDAQGQAGVFVAGSAGGPMSIAESISNAALAAEGAARFLQEGGLQEGGHV